MKNSILSWAVVAKEDLLDIFLGELIIQNPLSRLPINALKDGKLVIGFINDDTFFGEKSPTLLVIEDDFLSETMSWLRVFSGEIFPLSQFVRVVLRSDLGVFNFETEISRLQSYQQSERWASLAVGESLALAEGELELRTMALSRLSYSFSLPIGRTSRNFSSEKSSRICTDRLRRIESEQRFGRRSISIDQLSPIWALANSNSLGRLSAEEALDTVIEYAEKYYTTYKNMNHHSEMRLLSDFNGFKSNSIEERVMAFNRLVVEINNRQSYNNIESYAPIIAAAAWMVGRGTSHVFLLKKLGKISPISYVWFALIAALAGPRAWDSAWLRTVKGAERLLKAEFNWADVSQTDISWSDFSWLIDTFETAEQINSIPKMLPRTLSIEIVPGASVHVRLTNSATEKEHNPSDIRNDKEISLQNALSQFLHLSDKFRNLIEPNINERFPDNINLSEQKHKSIQKKT